MMKRSYTNEVAQQVGILIKEEREEKGYKQSKFPEELDKYGIHISTDTLKAYEQSKRVGTAETFFVITTCLETDLEKWKETKLKSIEDSDDMKNAWKKCPIDALISILFKLECNFNDAKKKFQKDSF